MTATAKLVWATPNGDMLIAEMARVSNPENEHNGATAPRLIKYLIDHQHWSPFEMVNCCIEVYTTRDIGRQLLRHRSFSFQEFSQRYATIDKLPPMEYREARMRDTKNRQSSLPCDNAVIADNWDYGQTHVQTVARNEYCRAIEDGIAPEVARAVLPEGLTPTRMYVNGTLRSWIHYLQLRLDEGTQKEHRELAYAILMVLQNVFPKTMEVAIFDGFLRDN